MTYNIYHKIWLFTTLILQLKTQQEGTNFVNEMRFNLNPSFFALHLLISLPREGCERKEKSCFQESRTILNIRMPINPARHNMSALYHCWPSPGQWTSYSYEPLAFNLNACQHGDRTTHSCCCSQHSSKNNEFIQSSDVHNIFADFGLQIQEYWVQFICIY